MMLDLFDRMLMEALTPTRFDEDLYLYENEDVFKLKNDVYTMKINVGKHVKFEDINLDLEDNRFLTIKYSSKGEGFSQKHSLIETLPDDADAETIDANVYNGIITVTVKQKRNIPIQENVEEKKQIKIAKYNNTQQTNKKHKYEN